MINKIIKSTVGQIIVICLFCFTIYSFILEGPFNFLDDHYTILNNDMIKSFDHIKEIFTSSFFNADHCYRPLVSLSFMLDCHCFGLSPAFFHLTNIIIHLITSIFVLFLVRRILKSFSNSSSQVIAFLVALLFAVHPVNSEAVSNIADRSIILSQLFIVSAFFMYCLIEKGWTRYFYYVLSLLLYALALLSRESAVMFPLVLSAYLVCLRNQPKDVTLQSLRQKMYGLADVPSESRSWFGVFPYFILLGIYILARKVLGIVAVYQWPTFSELMVGVITFLKACLTYGRLFFVPVDLHFDRSTALLTSLDDWRVYWIIIAYLILILFMLWWLRKTSERKSVIVFFFLWFWIELFPVSQLVATSGVSSGYISTAEHFLYAPSIPMLALIILLARDVRLGLSRWVRPQIFYILLAGFITWMFLITIQQNLYNRNPIAKYQRSYQFNPDNARLTYNLGMELVRQHREDEALFYFNSAVQSDPAYVPARIAIGKALCDQGKCLEAVAQYEQVLDPGQYEKLLQDNMAAAYEIVIMQYQERLKAESDNAQLHYSLGVAYTKISLINEAIVQYRKAIELDGHHANAMFNLASILDSLAKYREAIFYFEKALAMKDLSQENAQYIRRRLLDLYGKL